MIGSATDFQKEPKLVRARQIPEWDLYDMEIANFASRISGKGGVMAVSVDDLAGSKSASEDPAVEAGQVAEKEVPEDNTGRLGDEL